MFIRWLDEEIVRATMNIRIAARTLNTRADLTINPDPLLFLPLPSSTCWNPEVINSYRMLFLLRI